MCTVSFIARKRGYLLGMNRDEKLTRVPALPPGLRSVRGVQVLAPSEPGGGTWIALNEGGVTILLVNWYAIPARIRRHAVSRGEVVQAAGGIRSPAELGATLQKLPLPRINPFRLVGIFPATRQVVEWRWNLRRLVPIQHRWKSQQWISSGFDEPEAQRVRQRAFHRACRQVSRGRVEWLRRLHGSHRPACGPFSTCMHRADAATVSYTEISVHRDRGRMQYFAGPLCLAPRGPRRADFRRQLKLRPGRAETCFPAR